MRRLSRADPAPDFELRDGDGDIWRLSALKGQRVILYFYPADDTPGCTAEACDFRDSKADFQRGGYVVLGVSPQSSASHRAFTDRYGLNFPLLVDEDGTVATLYGARMERARGSRDAPLKVARSTFVIDEDGIIEHALYDVQARGHVEGLRELLAL
jgi:peroxiredoxin Q/BCP